MFDAAADQRMRQRLLDLLCRLDEVDRIVVVVLDAGGNRERMAYLFDKRAVTFTGLTTPDETKADEAATAFRV